jgi:hypothetical protein
MTAIFTKYLPATGTKGARVKASDGCGRQVTIRWNSAYKANDNHQFALAAFLRRFGFKGNYIGSDLMKAEQKVGQVWVSTNACYSHVDWANMIPGDN